MANINFFRNAANPVPEATKDKALQKEGVELYDSGQTESFESPEVNVKNIPQQNMSPTAVTAGDDGQYGFIEADTFDPIDVMEGYESPKVYDEMDAARQAYAQQGSVNNNFDVLGITEHHSDNVRQAAHSSKLGNKDFSHMGMAWRSIVAGIGSQIFTAAGDVIDWADSVSEMIGGAEDTGAKSIYEERDPKGTPYQQGKELQLSAPNLINPLIPLHKTFEYFTGIDVTKSFTDTLRGIGAALETVDDEVEQQFRDEHGEEFIKRDAEGNIKVDYGQLLIPDFWFTKVAKQIPNMVVFAYTGGAGSKAAAGAYTRMVAPAAVKKYGVKRATELLARYQARPDIGMKFFGSKITGMGTASWFGGGLGANLSEGAVLAGEAHKQALEEGLTKDQAAIVGLQVMRDNSYYMAVDALQYSIFDGRLKGLGNMMKAKTGQTFKSAATNILVSSGIAVADGKMEELQEVYQDWRVKTNLAKMKDEEFMSYYDYYNSPEVAETRLVSFAMGSLMGARGVVKSMWNEAAERANVIDNKVEASGFKEGGKGNLFAQAYAKLKQEGTKGGEFTQEEKTVNRRYEVLENAVLSSVALGKGGIELGKARLNHLLANITEFKVNKAEIETAFQLLEDAETAVQPYLNGVLKTIPVREGFRTEAVRLAYAIAQEQNSINDLNDNYDAQKAEIEARPDNGNAKLINQKTKEIEALEAERESAVALKEQTVSDYHLGMEQIQKDARKFLQDEVNKINEKNRKKRNEVKQQKLRDEMEKKEANIEENKKKAKKTDPKQREKRIEEIDERVNYLENTAINPEGVEVVKEEIESLKAEKKALQEAQKAETAKQDRAGKQKNKAKKKVKDNNELEINSKKKERNRRKLTKKEIVDLVESRMDDLKKYKVKIGGKIVADRYFGAEKVFRERLAKKGINLVVFDFFAQTKGGLRYYGMAQGLSVYLDASSATQLTLFHELAHVYLMEHWDSAPVKALKKLVLGEAVFQKAKMLYMDRIIFNNGMSFENLVFENKDIISRSKYIKRHKDSGKSNQQLKEDYYEYATKKLAKDKIIPLPDADQRIIIEEAVVTVMSLKKSDNDLNGLIDLPKKKGRVRKAITSIWGLAKRPFNKAEQKELLEKTGNEELANARDILDEVMKDYDAQVFTGKGKFEFRRDRKGFGDKLMQVEESETTPAKNVTELALELYEDFYNEEMDYMERDDNGKIEASVLEDFRNHVEESAEKIWDIMRDLEDEGGITPTEASYYFGTKDKPGEKGKRPALGDIKKQFIESKIFNTERELTEDESIEQEVWLENYLDNRNGDTSQRGKWAKRFVRIEQEIQGKSPSEEFLNAQLWYGIHDKALGLISESDYVSRIRDLQNKFKNKEELSIGEETLVRYYNYVESLYRGKGLNAANAVRDHHHDIKGFKRIEYLTYNQRIGKDGVVTRLTKPKGVEQVEGKSISKAITKRGVEVGELIQNKMQRNGKDSQAEQIKFISGAVDLHNKLNSNISEVAKREAAAQYIYNNLLPDRLKNENSGISVEGLMETDSVKEIVKDNGDTLFAGTAGFSAFPGRTTNDLKKWIQTNGKNLLKLENPPTQQEINSLISAAKKSLDIAKKNKERETTKGLVPIIKQKGQALYGMFQIRNGKFTRTTTEFVIKNQKGQRYSPVYAIKDVSNAIIENQRAQNFATMYQMPGGEKTAITSKKHQMDILMDMMPQFEEMLKTPEGRERFKELYGDNHIMQRMMMNGTKPILTQILGGEIFTESGREGFNAGESTGNQIHELQIELMKSAIEGNKKEYSQSISIFSDKSMEIHLSNAPLYNNEQAKKWSDKIFGPEKTKKYVNDLKDFLKETGSEIKNVELIEQIALNYALNKYYAKDLFIGPKEYFKNTRDYIKRSAGAVAMHVGLGNVRLEPIMVKDVMKGDVNRTDASSFILPEDAEYIEQQYGAVRPVGKHYKFVYYGQNLDNKTLESKVGKRHPFYGKTNVFILTKEFVKDNPNFAPLQRALRARRAQTRRAGTKVVPIIMTESAIKVTGNLGKHYKTVDQLSDLDALAKSQNELFQFSKDGQVEYGLDGSFFGVQTELDKMGSDATLSKQLMFMMYSNAEIKEEVDALMSSLVDAFKSPTDAIFNKYGGNEKTITGEKLNSILKEVLGAVDPDTYGKSTIKLLEDGSLDSGSLEVIESIVRSNIIKKATKMRGPGGLGVQSTDFAVGAELPANSISKSEGLKGYERDLDGNVITPAEVIIDESTAKNLKLTEGDTIIVQRIPTSKMGDGVVCKVKSITKGQGTMVIVSSDVSSILGSDLDGDALHIVGKNKNAREGSSKQKWNDAFDNMADMLMDGRNQVYTESGINALDGVVNNIKKNLKIEAPILDDLSIKDNRDIYLSNREGQKNIGISATYNNAHKILSSSNVLGMELNTKIDGVPVVRSYKDQGKSWLNLAYILNMFLDDANKGFAADLNLNEYTFPTYVDLISRGVELETAVKILQSPIVRNLVKQVQNGEAKSLAALVNEKLDYNNTDAVSIDINTDSLVVDDVMTLISKTNNHNAKQELDAIRKISSLDSNMPETTVEGFELIDSLLILASGDTKSKLDVSQLVSSNKDIETLRRAIFEGNFNVVKDAITFNNPLVQKNFETLLRYADVRRKMDPAFNEHQIVNKIFPIGGDTMGSIENKVTKKGKKQIVESIMARLRVESLFRQGVYGDVFGVTKRVMDSVLESTPLTKEDKTAYLENLNNMFKDGVPLSYLFHDIIGQIDSQKGSENYEFIRNLLRIEKKDEPTGYVTHNETNTQAVTRIVDGQFKNLKREFRKDGEYTIKPNKDVLKNMEPKRVKELFDKLPSDIQDFLYLYEAVENNNRGVNSLFPYLYGKQKSKIIKASTNNIINRSNDSLSDIDVRKSAHSVLLNNKQGVKDVTKVLDYKNTETRAGSIYVNKRLAGFSQIVPGAFVKINLPSNNGHNVEMIYEVFDGGKNVKLSPVLKAGKTSVFDSKSIPSNEKLTREKKDKGAVKMYQLQDEGLVSTHENKPIGKTKDGRNILDHDGKYGSEQMFQLVEEVEFFNEKTELNYADYARQNGVSDINNLSPEDKADLDKAHIKYIQDRTIVEDLTEKYLKKDALGVTELEKRKYSVRRLYLIIKNDINPLDKTASAKLYKEITKIMAAKMAMNSVNRILEINKDLSTEEKADLNNLKIKIEKGEKGYKDISQGDLWFSPDITTAERTEIGEMLKEVDKSEMQYRRELKKLKKKTDDAYNALLKEKFKGKIIPWWMLKAVYMTIPAVRYVKMFNQYIFGNLVEVVEEVGDDGKYYRSLRLKEVAGNNLTKAELNYYNMYTEMTGLFHDHLSIKKGNDGKPVLQRDKQKLYIPQRKASKFEMMINRNLTSSYIAHNYDSSLRDIHVKDESGRVATLGQFIEEAKVDQAYQGLSVNDWSRKNKIKRLVRQAEGHLKSGIDAAKLPAVRYQNTENLTEATRFNRYTRARSKSAEFASSFQIHANLNSYIETNFFYHGLDSKVGKAKGFSYGGAMNLMPIIDGIINYQEFKGNPLAQKWVTELYKNAYLLREGKKSLLSKDGKSTSLDKISEILMGWTMFIGLALKPGVAAFNIAIGKYNEFGRAGWGTMKVGEKRFWGEAYKARGFSNNKVWGITEHFGLISEPTTQTTEGMFGGPFGQLMFMFMTGSEAYIQRAAFVSQLTEAQWNSYKMVDGELVVTNQEVFDTIEKGTDKTPSAQQMKDNVYSVQGRGYTATDQRLVQNYFIVNGLLQFKRWFPTFLMDRVGGEKITRFGEKRIGSWRMTSKFVQDVFHDGNLGDVRKKFGDLKKFEQEAVQKFMRRGAFFMMVGFLAILAGAFDEDDESGVAGELKDLMMDMMLLVNVNKLLYMAGAPMLQTGENIAIGMSQLVSGAKYQRKTERFEAGDLKAKGSFSRTMPMFLRDLIYKKDNK